jgi:DNA-binding NtrC family response regulator
VSQHILFVEDEAPFRTFASTFLEEHGYRITHAGSASVAIEAFAKDRPDLVILDLNLPDLHGVEVLRRFRSQSSEVRIVVLTSYGDAGNAVTALKAGATDYLTKPIELSQLLEGIREALATAPRAVEQPQSEKVPAASPVKPPTSRRAMSRLGTSVELLGEHPSWTQCLERLEAVIEGKVDTVLLLGESGTGKSVLARWFHLSGRREGPFVEVECPSIPEQLLESELFGHERGAFTGATTRKRGQVELAEKGVLFLDEIGELPLSLQPKLLRFLERRRYRRVGGERDQVSNVQLVCATNRELAEEVAEGSFRRDLYYRLDVVSIRLPPLRERGSDVVLIAESLAREFAQRQGRPAPTLSAGARQALLAHSFPGNIRELRNLIQRAVVFLRGDVIEAHHLDLGGARPSAPPSATPASSAADAGGLAPVRLEAVVKALESLYVLTAMATTSSQREAGALLGLDRFALARRRSRAERDGRAGAEEALEGAPEWIQPFLPERPGDSLAGGLDLPQLLREFEERVVGHVLDACGSNRSRASAVLGMSRPSLNRRLEEGQRTRD